jgi:hexosaminidase
MRTALAVLALGGMFVSLAEAQSQPALNLMPWPAKLQMGSGQLAVDPAFSVTLSGYKDALLQRALDRFLNDLRQQTGMGPLNMKVSGGPTATLAILTGRAAKQVQELGEDESYTLEVTSSAATLTAPNSLGVLRGLQTFRQLVNATPTGFAVPAISVQDQPRFPWRGLLTDVGRHFIPIDTLKRNLEGMAAVKMNVLHLHLSENQGFRIESKKFSKLQELGSDGLYYTQAEMRDLIASAADRGIRVVPEFDMPGHSTAWFVGYPELASGKGPYQIDRHWGVRDPAMNPTQERTYKFLDALIGEMAKLFPDRYFHIGGDEVNGKEWDANPQIQDFMRTHEIHNNAALQAYFNKRVQAIVSKHGKIMMGWDEILNPDLPKSIVIQSWRGQASLAQAAQQGFSGLLSTGYYLDLNQSAAQHYTADPLAGPSANLTPEQTQRILGGEACMWTEYVSAETIDSRIWPRNAAIAERLWSPQSVNDVDSMYRRMDAVSHQLEGLGLTHDSGYNFMLRRIAGAGDTAALRTLADVVEPAKGYSREKIEAVESTAETPLNRLVDAVRPESETARHFAQLVNAFLAGQPKPGAEGEIRIWLNRWRDSNLNPQTTEGQSSQAPSFLLKEVIPVSQDLSALGGAGLEALGYLDRGERPPDGWKAQREELIQQAGNPKAEVMLMIVPSIQKLIEAASAPALPAHAN